MANIVILTLRQNQNFAAAQVQHEFVRLALTKRRTKRKKRVNTTHHKYRNERALFPIKNAHFHTVLDSKYFFWNRMFAFLVVLGSQHSCGVLHLTKISTGKCSYVIAKRSTAKTTPLHKRARNPKCNVWKEIWMNDECGEVKNVKFR